MFVTNSLSFLPQADYILMLESGSIVERGTYDELMKIDGVFKEFIKNYLKSKDSSQGNFNIGK